MTVRRRSEGEMGMRVGRGQDSFLSRALASDWIAPGLFFIALGIAVLWVSRDYPLGDLNRMGPGYFPRLLGIGMIVLGTLIAVRGLPELVEADGIASGPGRGFWLIPLTLVVFGLTVERLGLVIALAVALAIAGAAHREARLKEVALSIGGLIVLSVLVFVVVLKLPLRLWPDL